MFYFVGLNALRVLACTERNDNTVCAVPTAVSIFGIRLLVAVQHKRSLREVLWVDPYLIADTGLGLLPDV